MQGDSTSTTPRQERPTVSLLVGAHVLVALVVVLALSRVGLLVAELASREARTWLLAGVAGVGVLLDLRAIGRGQMSVGLRRQTPKALAHDADRPWWVTPLVWGGDTGMIWTTFRVSSASWLLLGAAVLGFAPWWAGVAYGLAFAVPLAVAIRRGVGPPVCQVNPGRGRLVTRVVQGVGVLVLAVGAVGLVA